MFDLITVGHFALDTISSPKMASSQMVLGGSTTYVSVAAAKLGAAVSVISKVGGDFPKYFEKWLIDNDVDLGGLKYVRKRLTTQFTLKYTNGEREVQLKHRAPSISRRDLPQSISAKVVHIAPLVNELSVNVVTELRRSVTFLSLDPQGFLRRFNLRGVMRLSRWQKTAVLKQIDVFKSSAKEVVKVTGMQNLRRCARMLNRYGIQVVILTRGQKGALLFFDNTFYAVPACKPRVVVDPTGAGDSFSGAFLAEFARSGEILWSACVGSAMASFVVEGVGPSTFGGKKETYERAGKIYDGNLKL